MFKTNRGLLRHLSFCRRRNVKYNTNSNTTNNSSNNIPTDNDNSDSHDSNGNGDHETCFWNEDRGTVFEKDLPNSFERIVHWKRNLFIMSSGAAGGKYIEEVTAF